MSEKQLTRSRLVSGRVIAGGLCCLIACLFIVLLTIPETERILNLISKGTIQLN